MSLTIFLSHAWRDKRLPAFKAIESKLRGSGYQVWVDKREIEYGEVITPRLNEAIERADVVLVLWSEHALASAAVRHEIDQAVARGKPLVPCKVGDADPAAYPMLRDRKFLRFDQDPNFALLQLSQFLVRFENRRHAYYQEHPDLQARIIALNEALAEVEDSVYRREIGHSGNAASDEYISSMLESGKRLIATSGTLSANEKAALAAFLTRVQEIARQYPDPAEDERKERLMIAAIAAADPSGCSATLQLFRDALVQSFASRRGTPYEPSLPTPMPVVPSSTSPPDRAQHHISTVLQSPRADETLRQRLRELAPGAGAAELAGFERSLRQAVEQVPALLRELAQAAQQAGVAHLIMPLLEEAEGYFLRPDDLVPEHHGVLGLLDDAYLVHGLLLQLNAAYQAHAGRSLLPHDPAATLAILRAVLGPVVAQQLDQAIVGAVNQIVQQGYYQEMVRKPPAIGRTGGPGAWGGTWEDEMARQAAELGFSFN